MRRIIAAWRTRECVFGQTSEPLTRVRGYLVTPGPFGGRLLDSVCRPLDVVGELLEQHTPMTQPRPQPQHTGEPAQGDANPDAIESTEDSLDLRPVTCQNRLQGVIPRERVIGRVAHTTTQPCGIAPFLFGCGHRPRWVSSVFQPR